MNLRDAAAALFNAIDAAVAVPVIYITSAKSLDGLPETGPFVVYRRDATQTTGTFGGGGLRVEDGLWTVSSYSEDPDEALTNAEAILNALVDAKLTSTDGYQTASLDLATMFDRYEDESQYFVVHLRFDWSRSG